MTEKKPKKAVKTKVIKALKQKQPKAQQPKGCEVVAVIDGGETYTYAQAEEAYAALMGDLMWLLQRGEALERALKTWPTECPCCAAKVVRS